MRYKAVDSHPLVHHALIYACRGSEEAIVQALPHMGPYDRLKQGMLCKEMYMVRQGKLRSGFEPVATLH